MKLLLDENLSVRLVKSLTNTYPGSKHVSALGLQNASDSEVWSYARTHGFVIVSKDSDFHQRSFILGFPPKVVWIRMGNCKTAQIERLLRDRLTQMQEFVNDPEGAFLILSE